jgi:predicted O-methyltransferase YrrM
MDDPENQPLLRPLAILARMQRVEGWLEDEEADLLIAAAVRALMLAEPGEQPAIVEVGSYCGRSSVVLGSTILAICPRARLFAVDPHEGQVGADSVYSDRPTLERFTANIAAAGLEEVVVTVIKRSYEVDWDRPIGLLFIDGLHDYSNVARDFGHFERWVKPGGFIAFHDYADYYPGVVAFVDELLVGGCYLEVDRALSLILLQKGRTVRPNPCCLE